MTQEEFNVVFELQMRKCADILAHKKKEYIGDNIDRLSAFKIAAALQNCDPKAALAGIFYLKWMFLKRAKTLNLNFYDSFFFFS